MPHAYVSICVLFFLLTGCNLAQAPGTVENTAVPTQTTLDCDKLINFALTTTQNTCDTLSRNEACYGHNRVEASFVPNAVQTFEAPGDIALLITLTQISTTAFNDLTQEWGVAILKAQADIPETLPGQNVTFILFGEVSLDGITPDVQAITMSTGVGNVGCAEAPPSAVLVQSPDGIPVTMNFNGASVTLGSTIFITAIRSDELTLATLDGQAAITAFGVTRTALPGAQVRLPLGTADGLQVVGPPLLPEPFDASIIQRAPLSLLPESVQIPAPLVAQQTPSPQALSTTTFTAVPPACVARSDWTATYVIQPGDTLFAIAQRYNVSVDELQRGNCIADANLISAGQTLRVPFTIEVRPTAAPTATPTETPTPSPTSTPPRQDNAVAPPTDTPTQQEEQRSDPNKR